MLIDDNNVKWFEEDNYLNTYDDASWSQFPVGWPEDTHIKSAATGSGELKWFAAENAIYAFDGTGWTIYDNESGLPECEINSISVDDTDVLWIATSVGLWCFDGSEWNSFMVDDRITDNDISAIAVDENNVKWFISTEIDILTFDNLQWNVLEDNHSYVGKYGITVDKDNNVWIGARKYEGYSPPLSSLFNPQSHIRSIGTDTNNVIWFGTDENGVYSYDGLTVTNFTIADGLPGNTVNDIAVDADDVKWIGGPGYVSSYDGTSWITDYELSARAIGVDADNMKWFAAEPGIISYDGISRREYGEEAGFVDTAVLAIAVDNNNVKWFGTEDRGVLRFDGMTWEHYTAADGLGSNRINGIAVDQENVVWFATPNGISSVDTDTLPVSAMSPPSVPSAVAITSNYPNPFNPATTIEFTLSIDAYTTLDVFNLSGQHVATLIDDMFGAGTHSVVWYGADDAGADVSSGVYFCRLRADGKIVVHRMVLMR